MKNRTFLVTLQLVTVLFLTRRTVSWSSVPLERPNASTFRRGDFRRLQASSASTEDSPFLDEPRESDVEAERLRKEARKLREEIEAFAQQKADMQKEEADQLKAELDTRQALIDQYSVVVPILKPDGTTVEEKIQFPPRLEELPGNKKGSSSILVCEAALPLGILLGEHEQLEGMTEVDEIAAGTNGELAGIQEGDLLRA
ncbi:MAG: hypothetical protein SGARI_007679, partial [Bacillariaceae sp.]